MLNRGNMSKHDAVNIMLSVIGEVPLSDTAPHADYAAAEHILDAVTLSVECEGWYFNEVKNVELKRENDGYFYAPNGFINYDVEVNSEINIQIIEDNEGRLVNAMDGLTGEIPDKLYVSGILFIPFEKLPEPAKTYIVTKAARRFQAEMVGSETLFGFSKVDEVMTRAALMRAQVKNTDVSYLSGMRNTPLGHRTMQGILNRRI